MPVWDTATAAAARRLEAGTLASGVLARAASWAWGRSARVVRPLAWPEGVRVVAVGGATLGGSGKTPLAIAFAEALARAGHAVALIGHAYGASPRGARTVAPDDDVESVGDEAIVCARALCRLRERPLVVVAGSRQAAVNHAVRSGATFLVLDGVAQTAPRRADLALLAVDARSPWGAGAPPPVGNLRASRASLLAAADVVVAVGAEADDAPLGECPRPVVAAPAKSGGARVGERLVPWSELAGLRLGLVTSVARPERVRRFVESRGVRVVAAAHAADHRAARLPTSPRVDAWLTTEKCSVHLARSCVALGELAIIAYALDLHELTEGRRRDEAVSRLLGPAPGPPAASLP